MSPRFLQAARKQARSSSCRRSAPAWRNGSRGQPFGHSKSSGNESNPGQVLSARCERPIWTNNLIDWKTCPPRFWPRSFILARTEEAPPSIERGRIADHRGMLLFLTDPVPRDDPDRTDVDRDRRALSAPACRAHDCLDRTWRRFSDHPLDGRQRQVANASHRKT